MRPSEPCPGPRRFVTSPRAERDRTGRALWCAEAEETMIAIVVGAWGTAAWADPPPSSGITGSNGVPACGWACATGSNGVAACSNVPWGSCAVGSDGRAVCLQGVMPQGSVPDVPTAECVDGSDGHPACG